MFEYAFIHILDEIIYNLNIAFFFLVSAIFCDYCYICIYMYTNTSTTILASLTLSQITRIYPVSNEDPSAE